jgi:hypothetical protein
MSVKAAETLLDQLRSQQDSQQDSQHDSQHDLQSRPVVEILVLAGEVHPKSPLRAEWHRRMV